MTDDDSEEPLERLGTGHVEISESSDDSCNNVAAVLWLPDPEARHFWREHYVTKTKRRKPGKKIGF